MFDVLLTDVLLTASVAFIITFLAIPVVLQIASTKKLYDIPDERKLHTYPVASLGGVAIFIGFLFSAMLSVQTQFNPEFTYFFAAMLVIFFLGLKDDLIVLSATKKFIGQMIAAAILIHMADIKLDSMFGLLGIEEVPLAFSLAMSYFTIILIINSFNLIDGVDGLAGSLGLLTMMVLGIYFFIVGQQAYALLAFSMGGSLIAFLIFNHHPAKIFMGDCGSLMLGLVNSILVIQFINTASDPVSVVQIPSAVSVAFAILFVPLFDTLRVFSIRIANGRSPFSPDRNHIHHLLLDSGLGHAAVTLTCVGANVFFIMFAYSFRSIGPSWLMLLMLTMAFSAVGVLYYFTRYRNRMVVAKTVDGRSELKSTSKLVNMSAAEVAAKIDQN